MEINNDKVETHLREYTALREEQKARFTVNSTILNIIVIIVGAELAAFVQLADKDKLQYFTSLIIAAPIITTPLILMYYDNQLMAYRVGQYFDTILYPQLRALVDSNVFRWEEFHQKTSWQFALVAFGRNMFFVLVTWAPIQVFVAMRFHDNKLLDSFIESPAETLSIIKLGMALWEKWILAGC